MHWYSKKYDFSSAKNFKIKVKKACQSMSDAQIQKPDLWWWQKKTKNIKNVLQIFFLSDLVIKTSQPNGFLWQCCDYSAQTKVKKKSVSNWL